MSDFVKTSHIGSKTVWKNAILRLVSKFKTGSRFTSLKQGDESQDSSTAPHENIAAEKEAPKIFRETVSPNSLSQRLDKLDQHLASLPTTSEWRLKLRNQWITRIKEYPQQLAILKTLASSSNFLRQSLGLGTKVSRL
jgi:hypothetical protein